MKTAARILILSSAISMPCSFIFASERLYVYPRLGQPDEQQSEDRYQCHLWARDTTGFDPMAIKGNSQPQYVRVPVPENEKAGATGKGMLGGAMAGAVIGEVDSDNPGKGAAIGAVVGALLGSVVEHEGERDAQEQAESEAAAISEDRRELAIAKANYRRALSACLEGRGYSVN